MACQLTPFTFTLVVIVRHCVSVRRKYFAESELELKINNMEKVSK